MNGLKIRKLAAIAAGAALVGAAAAPFVSAQVTSAQAKSAIYDAMGSPVMNLVVGQNAAISDAVWAGNIAVAAASKAVKEMSFTGGSGSGGVTVTDLSAVLALGGTVTVTGGKTFNSATLDSVSSTGEYVQDIGTDPLSFLMDQTMSYKYNGSNSDITVKEKVGVSLDAKFDTDKDLKDLVSEIDAGDVNYTLDLGAGIPIGSTAAATADFVDDSDDNIRIPFFGKMFLVQRVDIDSSRDVSELRLIEDKAKQTFVAGESFTIPGKGDYDGQTLTVTVVSIVATGPAASSYQAKFNLLDESGNVIDTQTIAAGNFVEFEDVDGDEVVSGDIYIDSAAVTTGTNQGTVDLLVGTASVRLKDGENYPYNDDVDAENLNGPYTVTITNTTDTNKLTKVVIKNRSKSSITGTPDTAAEQLVDGWPSSVFDDDNPLRARYGHLNSDLDDSPYEMTFLDGTGALGEGFFKVTFNGLQQDEELTYLKIGNNEVHFRDASDSEHKIPFWIQATDVDEGGLGTSSFSNGVPISFDNGNKTVYYDVNTTLTDFNVVNGTLLNGVAVTYTPATGLLLTDNGTVDTNTGSDVTINGVTYDVVANSISGVTLRADGYFHISKASLNSSTASSDYLQGLGGAAAVVQAGNTPTEALSNAFFYDDANANGISTAGIKFPLSGDSYTVAYAYQVIESDGAVAGGSVNGEEGIYFYLLGDVNSTPNSGHYVENPNAASGFNVTIPYGSTLQNGKRLALVGTTVDETNTPTRPYYYPQNNDVGQDGSSTTIYVATFAVDENNSSIYPYNVYMDTQTDEVPDIDDDDLSLPTSDVNYGFGGSGLNAQTITLSNKAIDTSIQAAYSDWGTKFSLDGSGNAVFWMPQNRPEVEFVVTGASSTTTVAGGEEIEVDEGETGTFTTGTQITVKEINYTATVSAGSTSSSTVAGSPFTYKTQAPLNGNLKVYTTATTLVGPKIIVGGPVVNALASEVADQLNTPGDFVAGVFGSNIIVAGYTAEDTGQAAQALINALEGIQ